MVNIPFFSVLGWAERSARAFRLGQTPSDDTSHLARSLAGITGRGSLPRA
jgi:hypothetical protein